MENEERVKEFAQFFEIHDSFENFAKEVTEKSHYTPEKKSYHLSAAPNIHFVNIEFKHNYYSECLRRTMLLVYVWKELGGKSIKSTITESAIDFCWWFVIKTNWRSKFMQPHITHAINSAVFVCILMYLTKTWLIWALPGVCSHHVDHQQVGQSSLSMIQSQHANNTPALQLQQTYNNCLQCWRQCPSFTVYVSHNKEAQTMLTQSAGSIYYNSRTQRC